MAKTQDQWQEVTANFFKLDTPGSSCQGTLVDKKIVNSTLPGQEAIKQTIYTLIQDDGTPVYIGGRGKQNPRTIAGIESCKMGQYIKFLYVEEQPAKTKGFHPTKICKVLTNGAVNQSVLDEYRQGKMGMTTEVQPQPDVPFDN